MINPFKELNWKPDRTELKKFGISLVIGFPIIAVILLAGLLVGRTHLFTPLGLFMRLIGRDALHLKKKPDSTSYWKDAPPAPAAENYFRQF